MRGVFTTRKSMGYFTIDHVCCALNGERYYISHLQIDDSNIIRINQNRRLFVSMCTIHRIAFTALSPLLITWSSVVVVAVISLFNMWQSVTIFRKRRGDTGNIQIVSNGHTTAVTHHQRTIRDSKTAYTTHRGEIPGQQKRTNI